MSSKHVTKKQNIDFVGRFVEVCGSSQPADVARILKISYQAAKNYLNGRLPGSNVLLIIAEKTPYSIHWLLTGQGDKFVETGKLREDTLLAPDALRAFVRRECLQIVGEVLNNQTQPAETAPQSKIVVLTSDRIKEEKISENSDATVSRTP